MQFSRKYNVCESVSLSMGCINSFEKSLKHVPRCIFRGHEPGWRYDGQCIAYYPKRKFGNSSNSYEANVKPGGNE